MTPYYESDRVVIYHGDCLDVLHGTELPPIHCVAMDPPYASGTRREASKSSSGAMLRGERYAKRPINNDQMTTQGFVWLMREVSLALYGALTPGANVLAFIDWRNWPNLLGAVESCNLRVNGMIVWDKQSMGLGNGYRAQHELVLHASKGVPVVHDKSCGNVLRYKRVSNADHPSPKPVDLMQQLLRVAASPGGLVVDPFMGAGATIEAAVSLGMYAVGIETEERYCEIAARRAEVAA